MYVYINFILFLLAMIINKISKLIYYTFFSSASNLNAISQASKTFLISVLLKGWPSLVVAVTATIITISDGNICLKSTCVKSF